MPDPDRKPQHLPRGLTATVGVVEEILGGVVRAAEGEALFDAVESVRRDMVAFRETEDDAGREAALDRAAERLAALTIDEKTALARAYTLYLQLVNVCENAYRTHRLRERLAGRGASGDNGAGDNGAGDNGAGDASPHDGGPSGDESPPNAELTFVLTAHPTESRSPENIRLLRRIQDHLVDTLDRGGSLDRREIENLLHLAWEVGTHPPEKPSVEDEANHLFSLLTDPILSEVVALAGAGHRVLFRTWVGGDKDGHPGVGPDETQAALQRARDRLLAFVEAELLPAVHEDVALLAADPDRDADSSDARTSDADTSDREGSDSLSLDRALCRLDDALAALETVTAGDGGRVEQLRRALTAFQSAYRERFGVPHPAVARWESLLEIFPALVVPLELREERGRFGADSAVADMMRRLAEIASTAGPGDGPDDRSADPSADDPDADAPSPIDAYARAVVVSMTMEAEDLLEAQTLADELLGAAEIPVIPLFELPEVLERAPAILEAAWEADGSAYRAAARARDTLEVMLGYSDTAKRMGMLASRVALHDAMRRIGEWVEVRDLEPLFFHGHGGSVGRGGGRIEDLAATWPPHARAPYKYTLQGEMVERTLATPEILCSLVDKVAAVQARPPDYRDVSELTRSLARAAGRAFAERVASDPFRRLLERATPYARLEALTIGSRPARRGDGGLEELRAIPWVLCWTQTRLLLHAWLGVGEAWSERRDDGDVEAELVRARDDDPLLRSYARLLSFTLAKTAPTVWRRYREALASDAPDGLVAALDQDFDAALDLACRSVGADTLLPDRPWLEESIRYRAPMIHPLNLLQIELLAEPDWSERQVELFRETVTGIAAGMLTTG